MPNPFTNFLPDWKGALNTFYEEKVKTTLNEKSQEYKNLLTQFKQDNKKFQNAVLAILITGLAFYTISQFWKNN